MSWQRRLFYALPANWRYWVRRIAYFPYDLKHYYLRSPRPFHPPKGMIFVGSGDFIGQGKRFLQHFIDLGGLQPHHHVLDIGCGIGRMAIPLTAYLDPKQGKYEGFDIMPVGIRWCQQNISTRFPHFRFKLVNLYNDLYKTDAAEDGRNFIFPYDNQHFDFIFLTSVFTHMLPEETVNYLNQISRVLKPNARCLATFFVEDEQVEAQRKLGALGFDFPYKEGPYALMDKHAKAGNVAYTEKWLHTKIQDAGLKIIGFYPGKWRGFADAKDFQDMFIFEKI